MNPTLCAELIQRRPVSFLPITVPIMDRCKIGDDLLIYDFQRKKVILDRQGASSDVAHLEPDEDCHSMKSFRGSITFDGYTVNVAKRFLAPSARLKICHSGEGVLADESWPNLADGRFSIHGSRFAYSSKEPAMFVYSAPQPSTLDYVMSSLLLFLAYEGDVGMNT